MKHHRVQIKESQHPRYSHVLEWYEGGKRKLKYVNGEDEAKGAKKAVLATLKDQLESDAPLSAGEWEAVRSARRAGLDVEAAVRSALVTAVVERRGLTVAQFCGERRAELPESGYSSKHLQAVEAECDRMERMLGEKLLAAVTGDDIVAMMGEWTKGREPGTATRRARRRRLHSLFESALRRRLVTANPVAGVDPPRVERGALAAEAVTVLSPGEARVFLEAVRDTAPALLPAVAIGMFAGLRTEELKRLEWGQVQTGRRTLEVRAAVAKTRARRIVDMQPALAHLLEQLAAPEQGRVWPANGERMLDAAKKAAGYAGRKHWAPAAQKDARPWPHNGLRDSFVSYHYAEFQSAALTAAQSGHSESVLFRHYRAVVGPEEAAAFWALRIEAPGWAAAVERAAVESAERRANKWRQTNYPKNRKPVRATGSSG